MGVVWQRMAVRTGRDAVKNGRAFVKHVVPAVIKPARTLWNEVIGFVFLCMGVIFGFKAARYVIDGDHARMIVAVPCTLLMLWFAISSFLRARRISRS